MKRANFARKTDFDLPTGTPQRGGKSPIDFYRDPVDQSEPANENQRRVPKSLRWAMALSVGRRLAFRFNPYTLPIQTAFDLYDIYRYLRRSLELQPGGWTVEPDFICASPERFIRRGTFTSAACGSINYMTPAAWNNYGKYVTLNGSGDVTRVRWYGWKYHGTWLGNIDGKRASRHSMNFSPAITTAEAAALPDPELLPASYAPPRFIRYAPQPLSQTLDPLGLPIRQPVGAKTPVPWRLIPVRRMNPYRSPTQQTIRGHGAPRSRNRSRSQNRPRDLPLERPPVSINSGGPKGKPTIDLGLPSQRPVGSPTPVHSLGPKGPKTKEGKVKVSTGGLLKVLNFMGTAEEGVDLLNALYAALPREYKLKYKNTEYVKTRVLPQEMLSTLYKHWDKVDKAAAVQNVINNQIEDFVYGKLGIINAEASAQALSTGPLGIMSYTSSIPKIRF